MSVSNKLNTLLSLSGLNKSDAAKYYGITRQSMANKFQRGYFSTDDLIRLCDLTGAQLTIQHPSGQTITLDITDLLGKQQKSPNA